MMTATEDEEAGSCQALDMHLTCDQQECTLLHPTVLMPSFGTLDTFSESCAASATAPGACLTLCEA